MADKLEPLLSRIDAALASTASHMSARTRGAVERWRRDNAALRFHLARASSPHYIVLSIVGGTGTGKSTLVNRLCGATLTASSFRRTFTAGLVAIAAKPEILPSAWAGAELERSVASQESLPARGRDGTVIIIPQESELARRLVIVDTPDLDGDQPIHHAIADRAFRWADAVVFVVTPEKYQMTELLPYYRLAERYALPTLCVMNKCEEAAVLEDYARLVQAQLPSAAVARRIFAVPRDDSAYTPPDDANLDALRSALATLSLAQDGQRRSGLAARAGDVLGRLQDQVVAPLREDRREADRLIAALHAMSTPQTSIDVNPMTQQLQRRLQQRSILYLMGPGRILDRVRQAPGLLARLPRVAWDYFKHGELGAGTLDPSDAARKQEPPDFRALLADQFALLHSRIDDALRAAPPAERWIGDDEAGYAESRLNIAEAGDIADEELADLKRWLEQRWNAKPRDTRAVEAIFKYLPGGRKLTQWSEAAPYLLTIVLAAHGAIFGHLDLIVLGGYGLATWLTERLSNEVTGRTRATNVRIAERFARLGQRQIEQTIAWINRQAPARRTLEQLESLYDEAAQLIGQ